MGKKIGILVEFNYEDLELWYPLFRLREEGYETFTIGPEQGKSYNSKHGYPCKADMGIDQVNDQSLDALIIPGGWCPDYLRRDKRFVDLVKNMMAANKVIATICHGAWMLCSAKCIQGRKLTCFVAVKDDVENAGAIYEDSPVVVDGNLVTSRVPTDLPEFCKAVLLRLAA
jgi:protease I